MKTRCFCILCPKHPLYSQRRELTNSGGLVTGYDIGKLIWKSEQLATGIDVNCLEPISRAFDELDIEPEEHEFIETAYGDGAAITGFDGSGYCVVANCKNEEYIEEENNWSAGE